MIQRLCRSSVVMYYIEDIWSNMSNINMGYEPINKNIKKALTVGKKNSFKLILFLWYMKNKH